LHAHPFVAPAVGPPTPGASLPTPATCVRVRASSSLVRPGFNPQGVRPPRARGPSALCAVRVGSTCPR
jgi:hypothetical protein